MFSINRAIEESDFEVAAVLLKAFGEWDAAEGARFGIPAELIATLFHSESGNSLAEQYQSDDALLLLAMLDGTAVGCIAFEPFTDREVEIQKFYVDPGYRGKRIGTALMEQAINEIKKRPSARILVHTTVYMRQAIKLYASFDFKPCMAFRDIPDSISHTEVFMAKTI